MKGKRKGLKMDRKNVSSGSPMEKPIGFSRASRVGNVIAVAGTAAIGPDGQTVGINNVYEQTKYCIEIGLRGVSEQKIGLRILISNYKNLQSFSIRI